MNFESPVVSPFSVFDMMMDPLAIAAGFGTGAGGMNAQQSLQQGNLLAPSTRIRSPIVKLDVGETPNLYIIKADLPGCNKLDVKVFLQGNDLIIEGERKRTAKELDEKLWINERSAGFFKRVIPLPEDIDLSKEISSNLASGVLSIKIHRQDHGEVQGRRIIKID